MGNNIETIVIATNGEHSLFIEMESENMVSLVAKVASKRYVLELDFGSKLGSLVSNIISEQRYGLIKEEKYEGYGFEYKYDIEYIGKGKLMLGYSDLKSTYRNTCTFTITPNIKDTLIEFIKKYNNRYTTTEFIIEKDTNLIVLAKGNSLSSNNKFLYIDKDAKHDNQFDLIFRDNGKIYILHKHITKNNILDILHQILVKGLFIMGDNYSLNFGSQENLVEITAEPTFNSPKINSFLKIDHKTIKDRILAYLDQYYHNENKNEEEIIVKNSNKDYIILTRLDDKKVCLKKTLIDIVEEIDINSFKVILTDRSIYCVRESIDEITELMN